MAGLITLNPGIITFLKKHAPLEERVKLLSGRERAGAVLDHYMAGHDKEGIHSFIEESRQRADDDAAIEILRQYQRIKEAGVALSASQIAFVGKQLGKATESDDAMYWEFLPDLTDALLSLDRIDEADKHAEGIEHKAPAMSILCRAKIAGWKTNKAGGNAHEVMRFPEGSTERIMHPNGNYCTVNMRVNGSVVSIATELFYDRVRSGIENLADVVDHALSFQHKFSHGEAAFFVRDAFKKGCGGDGCIDFVNEKENDTAWTSPGAKVYRALMAASRRFGNYDFLFDKLEATVVEFFNEYRCYDADIPRMMGEVAQVTGKREHQSSVKRMFDYSIERDMPDVFEALLLFVQPNRDKILATTDKKVRWWIKHNKGKQITESERECGRRHGHAVGIEVLKELPGMAFYKGAGLSHQGTLRRMAGILLEEDAGEHIPELYEGEKDNTDIYEAGLEFSRAGEKGIALRLFNQADLRQIKTEDDEFYDVIGDNVLSGYVSDELKKQGLSPSGWKKMINDTIKPGTIKRVAVDESDGLELTIEFNDRIYTYIKKEGGTTSRNETSSYIKVVRQSDIEVADSSFVKTYTREDLWKAERFWSDVVGQFVPIKRLRSSSKPNSTYMNEFELSPGTEFAQALSHMSRKQAERHCVRAVDLSFDIYNGINEHREDIMEQARTHGVDYRLTAKRIKEYFTGFYEQLRKLNSPEAQSIAEEIKKREEAITSILLGAKGGIVPWDYSPRNLMFENGVLILVDHERYAEGHPIIPAVTFATSPEIECKESMREQLISYAVLQAHACHVQTPPSVINAAALLHGVRRARGLAQRINDQGYNTHELDVHMQNMRMMI